MTESRGGRKIGAHLSVSGGLTNAVAKACEIGAECLQIFSGSPRIWKRTPLDRVETGPFFGSLAECGISQVFTHAIYLTNLTSIDPEVVRKTIEVLKHDMRFDSLIRGAGVVVHLGSHQGRGWDAVRNDLIDRIGEILSDSPSDATFLIENSAGQQGKLTSTFEDIRWVLDRLQSRQVGWCFDTCHAHAAGYLLGPAAPAAAAAAADESAAPGVLPAGDRAPSLAPDEIDRFELWDTLRCIHVNDSRDPFRSGRDRHANIADGLIPLEALRYFLTDPRLEQRIPLILEVPGLDDEGPDAENVRRLRRLLAGLAPVPAAPMDPGTVSGADRKPDPEA